MSYVAATSSFYLNLPHFSSTKYALNFGYEFEFDVPGETAFFATLSLE